jgi:CBS domain containing-hemolysin-like protein
VSPLPVLFFQGSFSLLNRVAQRWLLCVVVVCAFFFCIFTMIHCLPAFFCSLMPLPLGVCVHDEVLVFFLSFLFLCHAPAWQIAQQLTFKRKGLFLSRKMELQNRVDAATISSCRNAAQQHSTASHRELHFFLCVCECVMEKEAPRSRQSGAASCR